MFREMRIALYWRTPDSNMMRNPSRMSEAMAHSTGGYARQWARRGGRPTTGSI
jgi:hypothetical protein